MFPSTSSSRNNNPFQWEYNALCQTIFLISSTWLTSSLLFLWPIKCRTIFCTYKKDSFRSCSYFSFGPSLLCFTIRLVSDLMSKNSQIYESKRWKVKVFNQLFGWATNNFLGSFLFCHAGGVFIDPRSKLIYVAELLLQCNVCQLKLSFLLCEIFTSLLIACCRIFFEHVEKTQNLITFLNWIADVEPIRNWNTEMDVISVIFTFTPTWSMNAKKEFEGQIYKRERFNALVLSIDYTFNFSYLVSSFMCCVL